MIPSIQSIQSIQTRPSRRAHTLALISRYQTTGDLAAKNQVIIENMGLVGKIAAKKLDTVAGRMEYQDLVQEGAIALGRAVETYDVAGQPVRFDSYACLVIDRSIERAIIQQSYIVATPVHHTKRANCLTGSDIAAFERATQEEGGRLAAFKVRDAVTAAVGALPGHLRPTVEMYFGLAGERPMTQAEIGRRIGRHVCTIGDTLKVARKRLRENGRLMALAT